MKNRNTTTLSSQKKVEKVRVVLDKLYLDKIKDGTMTVEDLRTASLNFMVAVNRNNPPDSIDLVYCVLPHSTLLRLMSVLINECQKSNLHLPDYLVAGNNGMFKYMGVYYVNPNNENFTLSTVDLIN